jgi:hypothetical protein
VRVRDGDERESAAKGEKTSGREKWGEDSGLRKVILRAPESLESAARGHVARQIFRWIFTDMRGRVLAGR